MNCSIYLHLTLDIGGTNKIFHNREGTKTDLYLTHQLFCFRYWLFWDPLMSIYSTVVWISFSNIVSLLCTILFPIFEQMWDERVPLLLWFLMIKSKQLSNYPVTLPISPSPISLTSAYSEYSRGGNEGKGNMPEVWSTTYRFSFLCLRIIYFQLWQVNEAMLSSCLGCSCRLMKRGWTDCGIGI